MYKKPIVLTNEDMAEGVFLASGSAVSGNANIIAQGEFNGENVTEIQTTFDTLPDVETVSGDTEVTVEYETDKTDVTVDNTSLPTECRVVSCISGKVRLCCPVSCLRRATVRNPFHIALCSNVGHPKVNRCRWYC